MTPEDLEAVLARRDGAALVQFFAGASEADRKVVATFALEWYEVAAAYALSDSPAFKSFVVLGAGVGVPKNILKAREIIAEVEKGKRKAALPARQKGSLPLAQLAVIAACPLSDARRVGLPEPSLSFAAMADRRPRWLDRWLDHACEVQPVGTWESVRQMEREGLSTACRGVSYWRAMALTLGQKEVAELLVYLKADSEIFDSLLWSMLENTEAVQTLCDPSSIAEQLRSRRVLSGDFDWKSWPLRSEQWRRASYIWRVALSELSQENEKARQKLAELTFTWIARLSGDKDSRPTIGTAADTSPVGWFQILHDELGLSRQESEALVKNYTGLLSSKDASTLVWSLKHLSKQNSLAALPLNDILGCLPNVFAHKRKEPSLSALKFLEHIAACSPSHIEQAGLVALHGFDNKSGDIHKRTLGLLKKIKALDYAEVAAGLEERLDSLAGLLRKGVGELVAQSPGRRQRDTSEAATEVTEDSLDELLERARKLTGPLASAVDLEAAIAAATNSCRLPGALKLDSPDIPRLDPQQAIEPVNNLDDLVYLFTHVLEGAAKADDYERLLDGISRLCHLRPEDFDSRVSSLNKKIDGMLSGQDQQFGGKPFAGVNTLTDLAAVGRVWIDSKPERSGIFKPIMEALGLTVAGSFLARGSADRATPSGSSLLLTSPGLFSQPMPPLFFSERAYAVARRAGERRNLPLLSAPTHKGGWLDPTVLPKRIAAWTGAGVKPDKADYIQALLRLAPDLSARARALALMPTGKDELERALRFALGGEEALTMMTPEIWVAAFRCRDPRGNSLSLRSRFPELGPDCAMAASYRENLDNYSKRSDSLFATGFTNSENSLPIKPMPPFSNRANIKFFPTELLHTTSMGWISSPAIELIWPQYRESYFAYQTAKIATFLSSQGTYWQDSWDCLFDPDAPTCLMGAWLVALGLSARQPEAARLALDALIASIDDGRLDGTTFGAVLGKLLPTGKITFSRWITAFKDVARISPLHRHFLIESLGECLSQLPADASKSPPPALLELLYECCTSAQENIENSATRQSLSAVGGKGKGAKLASLLLELPPGKNARHRQQVAAQLLAVRVERVERWQSWLAAAADASASPAATRQA